MDVLMNTRKIRALIFDFDGLILDTEGPIFQSWQELYESYGGQLSFSTWAEIIEDSFRVNPELCPGCLVPMQVRIIYSYRADCVIRNLCSTHELSEGYFVKRARSP